MENQINIPTHPEIFSYITFERKENGTVCAIFGAFKQQGQDMFLKTLSRSRRQIDAKIEYLYENPTRDMTNDMQREQLAQYERAITALTQTSVTLG